MSARTALNLEQIIIQQYASGDSETLLGKQHGVSSTTIRNILARHNQPKRSFSESHARHHFRSDYFASIASEQQAYWLGFIAADGCVTRGTLEISLSEKDREHLELFRIELGWPRPLLTKNIGGYATSRPCVGLSIRRQQLIRDLATHGIGPRKSHTLVPWAGPPELMSHYWRGVFDGDGCINTSRGGHGSRVWSIELVGSLATVTAFANFIKDRLGFVRTIERHKSIYRVRSSGVERPQLVARLLYSNASIALPRKHRAAAELIAATLIRRRLTKSI